MIIQRGIQYIEKRGMEAGYKIKGIKKIVKLCFRILFIYLFKNFFWGRVLNQGYTVHRCLLKVDSKVKTELALYHGEEGLHQGFTIYIYIYYNLLVKT